jgi:hypothetical protein
MDARIKSGHDECVCAHTDINFKQPRHEAFLGRHCEPTGRNDVKTHFHLLAARCARSRAIRQRRIRVHRIPPHVCDDRETPLCWGGTAKDMRLIWVSDEAKYFLTWDWTTQITLIRFNKFRFARDGGVLDGLSGNARKAPTSRSYVTQRPG